MWLVLLGQEPSGQTPLDWVEFGVLGLVVVGLLTGLLWARPAVDRILRENDRLQERDRQRDQQTEALIGEVHGMRSEMAALRRELGRDRPAD